MQNDEGGPPKATVEAKPLQGKVLPAQHRVEPEAPIAAVSVGGLLNDKFQRLDSREVNGIARFDGAPNGEGTKDLPAICLDDKNHPDGVGLDGRVQTGFAAQALQRLPRLALHPDGEAVVRSPIPRQGRRDSLSKQAPRKRLETERWSSGPTGFAGN